MRLASLERTFFLEHVVAALEEYRKVPLELNSGIIQVTSLGPIFSKSSLLKNNFSSYQLAASSSAKRLLFLHKKGRTCRCTVATKFLLEP